MLAAVVALPVQETVAVMSAGTLSAASAATEALTTAVRMVESPAARLAMVTEEEERVSEGLLQESWMVMLLAVTLPAFSTWRVRGTVLPALRGAEVMEVTRGKAPLGWMTRMVWKAVRYCCAEAARR